MSTFKCKMCGGTLEIEPNETIATCEYCGTQQTLPKLDDERRANLYDRANHFRRNNEFDKAMGIYEKILNEDNTDAEAYWSLVLCRYGIEYVEDPASHKRVPTVNRAQFTSIYDDDNYKSALQYADSLQRNIYEAEAATINEIQKGILEISSKEEPFDVFICYKESDASGRRTPDSVLANELYHELTNEGFKVFFSRITLEDKLGTAYEPYIFAALNSAKVMVVLGTKPEYFNAVWVKNEWSRYLALIKAGQKKILIPAYKDMDPYDLPEEFSHLQAQDMTKLGFMQDLIRGIKKILYVDDPKPAVAKETVTTETATVNTAPLLKRAFMFLEDGNWRDADAYCEKVLDQDPENAEAYLGKLMAELHVRKRAELQTYNRTFTYSLNYQKIVRFGNKEMIAELDEANKRITDLRKKLQLTKEYNEAVASMDEASKSKDENAYKAAAEKFREISDFEDSKVKMETCLEKAEICRKECLYRNALDCMGKNTKSGYEQAIRIFTELGDWENSRENIVVCQNGIDEINKKDAEACENARIAAEQREVQRKHEAELHEIQEKKRKKVVTIVSVVVACAALIFFGSSALIKNSQYNKAHELMESGNYANAIKIFESISDYKDSTDLIKECTNQENYQNASSLADSGHFVDAYNAFLELGDYMDSIEQAKNLYVRRNLEALSTCKKGDYIEFGFYKDEPIEWYVLAVEDGKVLVISKSEIAQMPYNENDLTTGPLIWSDWETCSLRKWLNGYFIEDAFASEEKSSIAEVTVSADKNPQAEDEPQGNDTVDQVFLLSVEEAERYFASDEDRADKYFIPDKGMAPVWGSAWWLRTLSYYHHCASYVDKNGAIHSGQKDGYIETKSKLGVRPAMWISLNN